MRKKIFIILFLSIVVFSCKQDAHKQKSADSTKVKSSENIKEDERLISVIGVGDIMMGSNYPYESSLPPDDGKYLFDGVRDVLEDADITCGNLEGTLLDRGGTPKKCGDSTGRNCHSFRMPTRYAEYLRDAGFDFMNLANNHSGDMGLEGRESTYRTLEKNEISFAGTSDYPAILKYDGINYGFAGFAPNNGTVSIINIEKAKEIIEDLKKEADIVIVFFHGGAEGLSAQRVPKSDEMYLGEKRGDVYEFAHAVIDAGADIVFGSGPHVTRAIELYKNRIIAYSLGNFCTYGKFGLNGAMGIAPILKVYINKKGEFVKGEITAIKQIKRGFPVIDEESKVIKVIQDLTKKDFPGTGLIIEDNGRIFKKTKD